MQFPRAKLFFLFFLCCALSWAQFAIPEKPTVETSVYDYIDLLPQQQEKALEQKLIHYADSTSTQIVLAIISSTEGENINYLGAQWGEKWGIGQKNEDNGILILLANDDRKIGINTGKGIEEYLTDGLSKRIIDNIIIPEFKKGDFYSGLDKGADVIFQVLNGTFDETRTFGQPESFPIAGLLPFIIMLIIIIVLIKNRRKGGGRNNRGGHNGGLDIWDMIILSNMGRSSGGSSWGGGGSFGGGGFSGGFGGGSFGGGGASGGW